MLNVFNLISNISMLSKGLCAHELQVCIHLCIARCMLVWFQVTIKSINIERLHTMRLPFMSRTSKSNYKVNRSVNNRSITIYVNWNEEVAKLQRICESKPWIECITKTNSSIYSICWLKKEFVIDLSLSRKWQSISLFFALDSIFIWFDYRFHSNFNANRITWNYNQIYWITLFLNEWNFKLSKNNKFSPNR